MDKMLPCIYCFVRSRSAAASSRLEQIFAAAAVAAEIDTQNTKTILDFTNDRRSCTVTKKNAGIAVFPVHNAA